MVPNDTFLALTAEALRIDTLGRPVQPSRSLGASGLRLQGLGRFFRRGVVNIHYSPCAAASQPRG